MKLYTLQRTQKLPISLDQAWEFFSNPQNLAIITPPSLNLKPISDVPDKMYPGMIVIYRVKPFLGLGINWVTEITQVRKPNFFVDEQRFGPYRFWHHQHRFTETEGGIEAEDIVNYALPFGPLGRLAHALLIRRQLEKIFDYREQVLTDKFGKIE